MEATAILGTRTVSNPLARLLSFHKNRPDYSGWTIDQILALPEFERVQESYRGTRRRRDLHVLERLLGNYREFFANEILASINEMPLTDNKVRGIVKYLNSLDSRGLSRLPRFEVPLERVTGKKALGKGANIISYILVPLGYTDPDTGKDYAVLKSFVNTYPDKEKHQRAYDFARFYHEVHEQAMRESTEYGREALSRSRSLIPRYSKQGVISDTFLEEHDGLTLSRDMNLEEKLAWVEDKIMIDTAMSCEMTRSDGTRETSEKLTPLVLSKIMQRTGAERDEEALERMRAFYSPAQEYVVLADNNAGNVMIRKDKDGNTYTQRDFELIGTGSLALQLVQLLSKINIYDHRGEAVAIKEGENAEERILAKQEETFSRLGISYEGFREEFNRAKILENLAYAARYRLMGSLEKILNGYDARDIANYYYTLAVNQIGKQKASAAGKQLEEITQHEDDVRNAFGGLYSTLDEGVMRDIHERLNPQSTVLSFLKISDGKQKLERKLRRYSHHGKIGIAAACFSAALALSACAYYGGSLLHKVSPATLEGTMPAPAWAGVPAEGAPAQESIDLEKRLRLYTAMSIKEIRSTLKYRELFKKWYATNPGSSDEFALAEFYDGAALQRAIQATPAEGRKSWVAVSRNLPADIKTLVNYWQDDELQHKWTYKSPGDIPMQAQNAIDNENKAWDEQFGLGVRNADLEMLFADFDVYHGVKDLSQDIQQYVLQDIAEDLLVRLKTTHNYSMGGKPDLWLLPASIREFFSKSGIDWDRLAAEMKESKDYEAWMHEIIAEDGWKRFVDQEKYQAFKDGRTMHDATGKTLCDLSEQYDKEHWQDVLQTNFKDLMYSSRYTYNGSRYSYSWRLENTGDARIAALGMIDEEFYKEFMDIYREITGNTNPDYADIYSFLPKSVRFLFDNVDFEWEDIMKKKENNDTDFLGAQRLGQGMGQLEMAVKANNANNTYARSYTKMSREFSTQYPEIVGEDSREGWRETQQRHDQQYRTAWIQQNMPR